jgi:hypothetical protein
MGENRNAYKISDTKSERNMTFKRPGNRWEDNIKTYLKSLLLQM